MPDEMNREQVEEKIQALEEEINDIKAELADSEDEMSSFEDELDSLADGYTGDSRKPYIGDAEASVEDLDLTPEQRELVERVKELRAELNSKQAALQALKRRQSSDDPDSSRYFSADSLED